MNRPEIVDDADLEGFARAAARVAGLEIDEAWWPGVVGHLGILLARSASLESAELDLPEDPAAVFRP